MAVLSSPLLFVSSIPIVTRSFTAATVIILPVLRLAAMEGCQFNAVFDSHSGIEYLLPLDIRNIGSS